MKIKLYISVMGFALVTACGNSHESSSSRMSNSGNNSPSQSVNFQNNGTPQAQLVICPMCNGTGIFDYMPGDIMAPKITCTGCNGQGICDVNTAQQIIQAQMQVDAMMGGGGNGGYGFGNSGRSAYEIEYDLRKAYEFLDDLEENYNNCSSVVLRSEYPRMIEEQKERIRRLEAELRNAR